MKQTNLQKKLAAVAIGGVFALGMATQAMASPFLYDVDGLAGAGVTYEVGSLSGVSSEHLYVTSATTLSGSGYVIISSLNDAGGTPYISGTSYGDTGLYITYNIETTLTGGSMGLAGSTYELTTFDLKVYKDINKDNGWQQAVANTLTEAAVLNTSDDILLATGDLMSGTAGLIAGSSGQQTANITVTNGFELVVGVGDQYFYAPAPFYNIAFSGFNSTGNDSDWEFANNMLSIRHSVGITSLENSAEIPEPATLALLGIGLLGFGARRALATNKKA